MKIVTLLSFEYASVVYPSEHFAKGELYIWHFHLYASSLVVAGSCCALCFFSGGERFAAPTCLCCIWVLEGESTTDKGVTVVQLHSKHEKKALRVADYRRAKKKNHLSEIQ